MTVGQFVRIHALIEEQAPSFVINYHTLEDVKQEFWRHAIEMLGHIDPEDWKQHLLCRMHCWKRNQYTK
jgi:hypothetical protein